jgi:stress-induced morphogen
VYTPERLEREIEAGLGEAQVFVTDLTGTRDHYKAVIVCAAFEGKRLLERHQMVYQTLGSAVGGEIHALTLETHTPQQWAQKQGRE